MLKDFTHFTPYEIVELQIETPIYTAAIKQNKQKKVNNYETACGSSALGPQKSGPQTSQAARVSSALSQCRPTRGIGGTKIFNY